MAKKKSPPPHMRFVMQDGTLTLEARRWLEETVLPMSATQTDASTVSDPPTQAEVNAIVTVINALIDKLQTAGLME